MTLTTQDHLIIVHQCFKRNPEFLFVSLICQNVLQLVEIEVVLHLEIRLLIFFSTSFVGRCFLEYFQKYSEDERVASYRDILTLEYLQASDDYTKLFRR